MGMGMKRSMDMIRSSIPLMIAAALLAGCGSKGSDKLKTSVNDLREKVAAQEKTLRSQELEIDRLVAFIEQVKPQLTALDDKVSALATQQTQQPQTVTIDPDQLRAQVKEIVEPILERRLASLQGRTDRADRADRGTRDGNRGRRSSRSRGSSTRRLIEEFNLTDDQTAKVEAILEAQGEKRHDIFAKIRESGDWSGLRAQLNEIQKEISPQLKELLSEEQFAQYEKHVKERSARWDEWRSKRGGKSGHGRGKK